jgi:outer membrane lipoprotein-sorting protein
MKPVDKVNELITKSDVTTGSETNKRIIGDALAHLEKIKQQTVKSQPYLWRIIMKSPITKIATAAVIIIACVMGLSLWRATGSGIALADVLTRIEKITGYAYQMSSTMTRREATSKWTSHILVSKENGIKMTITAADPNNVQDQPRQYRHEVGDEAYLLPQQKSLVFVKHKAKIYDRYIYDGQKLEYYKEEYNEPHTIIKQILSCEHTSMGQSVIDEVTVEGFQTTDIAYQGGFFGQAEFEGEHETVDVRLWVDVNTFLPVRLEEDIVTKKGLRMHEVSYDFRWNVIVNPDDFEPNIPDDYRAPAGDIVIPGFDEENVIKGLKLFAAAVGSYPADLEMAGREFRLKSGFDPSSYKDMSDEERTKKTSEIILMAVPGLLYKSLVEESKEPAYYGETVRPNDNNKVLLRWKLDEGQYRVIFGDLRVKTVTTEELGTLERPSAQ